jgi:ribokinase
MRVREEFNSRIVVIGSLNADMVVTMRNFPSAGETVVGESFTVYPGGKGANQAFAAARLGGKVAMIGQVGNDRYAESLIGGLATAGVDTSFIQIDSSVSSGIASISIDGNGQNQIVIIPGANGTFYPDRLIPYHQIIESASVVLLQLEIPLPTVIEAARIAKRGKAIVILDPAPAIDLPDTLLKMIDYITPNEIEAARLTSSPVKDHLTVEEAEFMGWTLHKRGVKKVIIKMGYQGAIFTSTSESLRWEGIKVDAVDTTAAGDVWNAAFAFMLASGRTETEAGKYANAASAISVMRNGAQPSMPTARQVSDLLNLKNPV